MIIFRTGLSESTVFEIAYNIFKGKNIPIFYAIEPGCEIKTTLLRDLNGYCDTKIVYKVIENGIENITNDIDFIKFLNLIN
jgi:carbamoyl-phosphate synthase large subunit